MRSQGLAVRTLLYYWRTNLAIVAAVAVAVGVLAGALVVGDSMRASLRELFLSRLGRAEHLVSKTGFFPAELSDRLQDRLRRMEGFSEAEVVPIVSLTGGLTHEPSGRRARPVELYGVDDRFFEFHRKDPLALELRGAAVSSVLASELDIELGDSILVRVENSAEISAGSLFGRRDDTGRTMRLRVDSIGEDSVFFPFSISANQGEPRTVFVPLSRIQRELDRDSAVNSLLVTGAQDARVVHEALSEATDLETLGVSVSTTPSGDLSIASDSLMVNHALEMAGRELGESLGVETVGILAYLANALSLDAREVPYSLVAGVGPAAYRDLSGADTNPNGLVLNDWAAAELEAQAGDTVTMTFYLWQDEGRIAEQSEVFEIVNIVSVSDPGWASDARLAPTYPGISDVDNLGDWDPPFPIDFRKIDDRDEQYWDDYRATPKAFIPLARAQQIWPVRQGALTGLRYRVADASPNASSTRSESASQAIALPPIARSLRGRLSPMTQGFSITPVRELGLVSSRGATDFGEYFVYFSYFLMVSGLLLTGLFFKLLIEQRREPLGMLLAFGFSQKDIRGSLLWEAVLIAGLGTLFGLLVAIGYASFVIHGLRTFWVDAVGTSLLSLYLTPRAVMLGLSGGFVTAVLTILVVLRRLGKKSPRELLTGAEDSVEESKESRGATRGLVLGLVALAMSAVMAGLAFQELVSPVAGFFGAGNLVLLGLLSLTWVGLKRRVGVKVRGSRLTGLSRLGFRNASYRPGRSLVAIALIAFAVFMIVSVDAFRKRGDIDVENKDSGTGGYPLVAEAAIPLHWDIEDSAGRDELGLPAKAEAEGDFGVTSLRLRPGEDASCLNLYRPQNPRIVGVPQSFREEGRFRFSAVMAGAEPNNPWRLLDERFDDGAIPVIGDANSMQYVLHVKVGERFEVPTERGEPVAMRLVATLSDSFFQSELLIAEERFLNAFPTRTGFQFFLIEAEPSQRDAVTTLVEDQLQDFEIDVESTAARLASFHRVENTYLSTFQTLGGLGLMLGTFGLGIILLRNVLERRSEFALLRAIGYSSRSFGTMVLAENAFIMIAGLTVGVSSALIAITPALSQRGDEVAVDSLVLLLAGVGAAGFIASLVAIRAAVRMPLLASLRGER